MIDKTNNIMTSTRGENTCDLDHRPSQSPVTIQPVDERLKLPFIFNTPTTHSVKNIMSINNVTEATTREYIVYLPMKKKRRSDDSPPSTPEERQELTVQIWQEYTREVGRNTEDRARQQSLKRYKTCSPRGIRHAMYTSNEIRDHEDWNALYRPRRMFVKR